MGSGQWAVGKAFARHRITLSYPYVGHGGRICVAVSYGMYGRYVGRCVVGFCSKVGMYCTECQVSR